MQNLSEYDIFNVVVVMVPNLNRRKTRLMTGKFNVNG